MNSPQGIQLKTPLHSIPIRHANQGAQAHNTAAAGEKAAGILKHAREPPLCSSFSNCSRMKGLSIITQSCTSFRAPAAEGSRGQGATELR